MVTKNLKKKMFQILEQSYLCPLSPLVQPVFWEYHHALQLYTTPDALVLADSAENYNWQNSGCDVFNPGNFSKSKCAFLLVNAFG